MGVSLRPRTATRACHARCSDVPGTAEILSSRSRPRARRPSPTPASQAQPPSRSRGARSARPAPGGGAAIGRPDAAAWADAAGKPGGTRPVQRARQRSRGRRGAAMLRAWTPARPPSWRSCQAPRARPKSRGRRRAAGGREAMRGCAQRERGVPHPPTSQAQSDGAIRSAETARAAPIGRGGAAMLRPLGASRRSASQAQPAGATRSAAITRAAQSAGRGRCCECCDPSPPRRAR
jgi:hypothetical protein